MPLKSINHIINLYHACHYSFWISFNILWICLLLCTPPLSLSLSLSLSLTHSHYIYIYREGRIAKQRERGRKRERDQLITTICYRLVSLPSSVKIGELNDWMARIITWIIQEIMTLLNIRIFYFQWFSYCHSAIQPYVLNVIQTFT